MTSIGTRTIVSTLVAAIVLGVVISVVLLRDSPTVAGRELVVVSYGGAWQNAQRKAFFEPFAKNFNVRICEESWSGDFGQLKAMVESGKVAWDAVDVEAYMVLRGAAQNLLEKLDY